MFADRVFPREDSGKYISPRLIIEIPPELSAIAVENDKLSLKKVYEYIAANLKDDEILSFVGLYTEEGGSANANLELKLPVGSVKLDFIDKLFWDFVRSIRKTLMMRRNKMATS